VNLIHRINNKINIYAIYNPFPNFLARGTPAVKRWSECGIVFPKESLDECQLDNPQMTKGTCRRIEDCPSALRKIRDNGESPKTCYFIRFDHFVCCDLETELPEITTGQHNVKQINENDLTFVFSVVGGMPTRYREYPFMAALGWRSNFDDKSIYYRCGGALISDTYVLTAAHCIDFGGDPPNQVRLGGDNLTLTEGEDVRIRRVIVHPDYDSSTDYNDIALLELESPAKPELKRVCLWYEEELANTLVTAIGYGQTSFAGLSSAQLLKVPLQRVSNDVCQFHYSSEQLTRGLLSSQLCAGDDSGTRDTCQGDSGGPLIMQSGPLPYVVGITSHGQGCASGPPTVYTRVSSYLDWIEGHVWPEGFKASTPAP
ncbi:hypothetical protein KR009_008035, partial [Drosophila setifemur]